MMNDLQSFVESKEELKIDRNKDFGEWWRAILRATDIVDDRYPAKGFYYYPSYGYEIVRRVFDFVRDIFYKYGFEEERYPALIPASIFMKEKEFFEGFQGEGYVIKETLQGEKLEEPLILRPTSETAIYHFWSLRIKSYRDLPKRMFQIVNIWRCETKMTKPFLRLREVTFFKEAHTAHRTREESEKQIEEAIEIYKKILDTLLIPYIIIRTPKWDTFPGALYNYDFITVLPDKKLLELGSVINLGQKFSEQFDIKFLDEDGKEKGVWQTCFGISERLIGAMLALHSDDLGLVIHPDFAPIQIVIVPILKKNEDKDKIIEYSKKIKDVLEDEYRVFLDIRDDKTAGWKYYYWDLKGVPLRIDIGKREVEEQKVTVVRRDTKEKISIDLQEIPNIIRDLIDDIKIFLKKRAENILNEYLTEVTSLEDAQSLRCGIIPVCNNKEHADLLKEKDIDIQGFIENYNKTGKCIVCGKDTTSWAIFGKTY